MNINGDYWSTLKALALTPGCVPIRHHLQLWIPEQTNDVRDSVTSDGIRRMCERLHFLSANPVSGRSTVAPGTYFRLIWTPAGGDDDICDDNKSRRYVLCRRRRRRWRLFAVSAYKGTITHLTYMYSSDVTQQLWMDQKAQWMVSVAASAATGVFTAVSSCCSAASAPIFSLISQIHYFLKFKNTFTAWCSAERCYAIVSRLSVRMSVWRWCVPWYSFEFFFQIITRKLP